MVLVARLAVAGSKDAVGSSRMRIDESFEWIMNRAKHILLASPAEGLTPSLPITVSRPFGSFLIWLPRPCGMKVCSRG